MSLSVGDDDCRDVGPRVMSAVSDEWLAADSRVSLSACGDDWCGGGSTAFSPAARDGGWDAGPGLPSVAGDGDK